MTDSWPLHTLSNNCLSIKRAYLQEVILPALQNVAGKNTPTEKYYLIGGRNLCVRFYSPALSESLTLIEAFELEQVRLERLNELLEDLATLSEDTGTDLSPAAKAIVSPFFDE